MEEFSFFNVFYRLFKFHLLYRINPMGQSYKANFDLNLKIVWKLVYHRAQGTGLTLQWNKIETQILAQRAGSQDI